MNTTSRLVAGLFAASLLTYAASHQASADWQQELPGTSSRRNSGETILLESPGGKLEALYLDSVGKQTHGGVILLHGLDAPADAIGILQSLRLGLPARGWSSLSPRAPRREAMADWQSLPPSAMDLVNAAVVWLKEKKVNRIALIGHHAGARMALGYLAGTPDASVIAAVVIDPTPAGTGQAETETLADLAKIKLPLLDILAGRESSLAIASARQRQTAAKNNPAYRQTAIADLSPRLDEVEGLLINHIHGWLLKLTEIK